MSRTHVETLRQVLPGSAAWPLFDVAATRGIEAEALAALPAHALMQRAGLAIARLCLAINPLATSVHAFAGPGNNGGDSLVAAALLAGLGWQVRASLLADAVRLPQDAQQALQMAQVAGVRISTDCPPLAPDGLCLDGLLGLGGRRQPEGAMASAIDAMNRSRGTVIAIDLPSGLDGERGTVLGSHAVRASHTLSLLTLKPGLFTASGRDHAGQVWLDSLGIALPPSRTTLSGRPVCGDRPHTSHKGSFGDLWIVGGDRGMVGAAWLAAQAGLSAGAGRVYLCALAPVPLGDAGRAPELMHRPVSDLAQPAALATKTVVCGCGGGDAVRDLLPSVLGHAERLVLDADALNAVAAEAALQRALHARAARGRATILTPHPLEAARLLGTTARDVQADRLASALALAQHFNCIVVLKGSGTILATATGDLAINPTGNPLLATPGSGDVLAGWIGGTWAQAGAVADAFAVASASVWYHGHAADRVSAMSAPRALPASALIDAMRHAPR